MIQSQFNSAQSRSPQRILAIIVLYNLSLDDCVTYKSLRRSLLRMPAGALDLSILLYDNSPTGHVPTSLPTGVHYMAAPTNRGLATGYNHALCMAVQQGYDWLLTLDQDTDLPENALPLYVSACAELGAPSKAQPGVAAIVPQIIAEGRVVSPNYFAGGFWPRWFPADFSGVPSQPVFAFNSGTLVRVAALQQMGGYSPWFWLDNSDSALFANLAKLGKQVYLLANLKLQHDFSMLNMRERVSPQRYQTILLSESAFWDMEMNVLAGLERTARLVGRTVKHRLRHDPPQLRQLTRRALRARLLQSRATRIATWRSDVHARLNGVIEGWAASPRPRVSVCLVAGNGERIGKDLLRSVILQLTAQDEVLLAETATDDTTAERHPFRDENNVATSSAPRLWQVGPKHEDVKDLLRSATGDVLVLCGAHAPWSEHTVAELLQVFAANPETMLVQASLPANATGGNLPAYRTLSQGKPATALLRAATRSLSNAELIAVRPSLVSPGWHRVSRRR